MADQVVRCMDRINLLQYSRQPDNVSPQPRLKLLIASIPLFLRTFVSGSGIILSSSEYQHLECLQYPLKSALEALKE